MERMEKTPENIAQVMAERLDDPPKRAQSKPEDDGVAREIRYGYGLLCAIPFAVVYGFDFLIPILLFWGVMPIVSTWKVELRLWHGDFPTTVGWVVGGLGLAWSFAILVT